MAKYLTKQLYGDKIRNINQYFEMILFWGIPKCKVWNNDEMEEYCLLLDNIHPDKIQIKCER